MTMHNWSSEDMTPRKGLWFPAIATIPAFLDVVWADAITLKKYIHIHFLCLLSAGWGKPTNKRMRTWFEGNRIEMGWLTEMKAPLIQVHNFEAPACFPRRCTGAFCSQLFEERLNLVLCKVLVLGTFLNVVFHELALLILGCPNWRGFSHAKARAHPHI